MKTAATRLIMPLLVGAFVATSGARAQTFDVKQLEVSKGEVEYGAENMAARGVPRALGSDVKRLAGEQSMSYGLTDWWRISAALKIEKPEADEARLAQAALGNIFILKGLDEKRSHDFGVGWFTEIGISTHRDTTNTLLFGPIATMKADKLSITVNPFFEQTFGRNREDGIAFAYGWQAKCEIREGFAVGIEGFGVIDDIGNAPPWRDQEHRIGPVLYTEVELHRDFKIAMDVGVMVGLTEATPDMALKLNFGIPLSGGGGDRR